MSTCIYREYTIVLKTFFYFATQNYITNIRNTFLVSHLNHGQIY